MTTETASYAAYLVAALLFILSLAGLSKHETSRNGVLFGIVGMTIALVSTFVVAADWFDTKYVLFLLAAVVVGAVIGLRLAATVEMTGMPELIALLHSFVGLAAVLVGWNSYLSHEPFASESLANIHHAEIFIE